jgi:hypothetical protein
MIQSIRAAIKSLMTKAINAGLSDQLTILQGIDSNDQQIQDIQSALPSYVFKAIVSQAGGAAPTINTLLVNTFPEATFSLGGTGVFTLDLGVDLSQYNVTTIQDCVSDTGTIGGLLGYVYGESAGANYQIQTADNTLAAADDILVNYTLVIEAYPA